MKASKTTVNLTMNWADYLKESKLISHKEYKAIKQKTLTLEDDELMEFHWELYYRSQRLRKQQELKKALQAKAAARASHRKVIYQGNIGDKLIAYAREAFKRGVLDHNSFNYLKRTLSKWEMTIETATVYCSSILQDLKQSSRLYGCILDLERYFFKEMIDLNHIKPVLP